MNTTSTVKSVVSVAQDRNLTLLAAGFAYYAFASAIPLVVLFLILGSIVGGEAFTSLVVEQVGSFLSGSGEEVVQQALSAGAGRTGAGIVGFLLVVWSAIKVVRGLDVAFAEIYATVDDPSLVDQVTDGLVTLVGVVFAVGLMIAVGVVLRGGVLEMVPYPNLLGALALLVGLTVGLLPLYYVLPETDMTVRRALPGAAVAAVGWLVLQFVFQAYLAGSGKYAAYGFLGAVLLFVTFLYFAGILLLVGTTLNYVLGPRPTRA
ncbi:YihY/virulence factor BrkB family protein [Halomarina oriensis]|uniref:YihY/virulence factor BrkB family protein n=1 Tax=Halomarina oriensis TaxID=671145 RepID=A0A6B0GHE7_9EURY|nr:YihY/virulence factor BrkB family protein [Halomarina oriensis]MWG34292.1 YihY/virulence factor BrkB family protein [Halomarina oriensis]